MASLTVGQLGLDMTFFDVGELFDGDVAQKTATLYQVELSTGDRITFGGAGFTYGADSLPTGGTITSISLDDGSSKYFDLTGVTVPVATFAGWVTSGDTDGAFASLFAGADTMTAAADGDDLFGYGGNDLMIGAGVEDWLDGGTGDNTIIGGQGDDNINVASGTNILDGNDGDDYITGGSGQDFVRGLEGDDFIDGGGGADDVNGNKGDDEVNGGDGADTVRGGQGDDLVFGGDGDDPHVNGNIGNDTVHGDAGADTVFGGQNDDDIYGDDGNDYLSGDLGSDTMTGGNGADTFHLGFNGGHDYVTDFKASEGDKVLLDHGASYTVTQSGPDTVVTLSTGEQLTLQGVNSSTLPAGWIVVS
jgi:Ca2+-binding RTX toxin-like protein